MGRSWPLPFDSHRTAALSLSFGPLNDPEALDGSNVPLPSTASRAAVARIVSGRDGAQADGADAAPRRLNGNGHGKDVRREPHVQPSRRPETPGSFKGPNDPLY